MGDGVAAVPRPRCAHRHSDHQRSRHRAAHPAHAEGGPRRCRPRRPGRTLPWSRRGRRSSATRSPASSRAAGPGPPAGGAGVFMARRASSGSRPSRCSTHRRRTSAPRRRRTSSPRRSTSRRSWPRCSGPPSRAPIDLSRDGDSWTITDKAGDPGAGRSSTAPPWRSRPCSVARAARSGPAQGRRERPHPAEADRGVPEGDAGLGPVERVPAAAGLGGVAVLMVLGAAVLAGFAALATWFGMSIIGAGPRRVRADRLAAARADGGAPGVRPRDATCGRGSAGSSGCSRRRRASSASTSPGRQDALHRLHPVGGRVRLRRRVGEEVPHGDRHRAARAGVLRRLLRRQPHRQLRQPDGQRLLVDGQPARSRRTRPRSPTAAAAEAASPAAAVAAAVAGAHGDRHDVHTTGEGPTRMLIWIIIIVVVLADRRVRRRRLQPAAVGRRGGAGGARRHRRPAHPARRPDPQPGRDRQGLRRPREERASRTSPPRGPASSRRRRATT